MLFVIMLFYGIRMRLVSEHGGMILLMTTMESDEIQNSYEKINEHFKWNLDTRKDVSFLQSYFLSHDKPGNLLLGSKFEDIISKDERLRRITNDLEKWVKEKLDERKRVETDLTKFVESFQLSIDKLFSDWET